MTAGEPRLAGLTVLATGASRGIGLACAGVLAAAGARVVLVGRDEQALMRAVDALGASVHSHVCDLADDGAVAGAAAAIRRRLGAAPDIIVNAAGQFLLAPANDTPLAGFERLLRVNLVAPFALVREFLPELRERGRGHVVNIGSLADRVPLEGNAAYAASKFGLRGLHGVLREELRGSGVRVTLVSPAHVDTQIWDAVDGGVAPRPDMLRADAVAQAVLYAVTAPAEVNVDELRLSRS